MNCVSEKCKYVRFKVVKDNRLKYFRHMLVPYCELGKTVSYPFVDDGKKDMRCKCYAKTESENKKWN